MNLDEVIAALYESVSFEPGTRPDWSTHAEFFAPAARMVRVSDDGVFEFDIDAFRKNFEGMIDSGKLPSFWEGELWRETRLFGEVAHVLSAYETRWTRDGELLNRGVNSIQLFQRDGSWWISAMLWRREGKNLRIGDQPPTSSRSAP